MNKMSFAAFCGVLGMNTYACYAPEDFFESKCDATGLLPSRLCVGQADAGADADGDTDAKQNAIDDPGLNTANMAPPGNCNTGHCLPVPTGDDAGLWSTRPLSLWIGPVDQAPTTCPDDPVVGVPNLKFRLFDKLVAPSATCPACTCGPSEGTCTDAPEKIELRAGKCNQSGVPVYPFDGPAGWGGLCSNDDTIAASAKCPAGSQTLCAQSVRSSALPLPADEACKASASAPPPALETAWEVAGVACHANTEGQSCGTDTLKMYCVNTPGPAWLQCVYRDGVHETCPGHYTYRREVLYPKAPIDTRECLACTCGAPVGSICKGTLGLYADTACGVGLINNTIASTGESCFDLQPPGLGIGSKAVSNLTYLPGTCAASGGEPVGNAIADVQNAVTFCCMEPIVEIDPPR